jgi:exosortase A-associated hydrolase 2
MPDALETFVIPRGGHGLLAHGHMPAGDVRGGLVMVHPFGEEKKCAHRALYETARALQAHGVATLRFDLSGCGDSTGNFRDARVADWVADIEAACAALRERVGSKPFALLGLRVGATLAAEAARQLYNLTALVLWQPFVHGKREFTAELRRLLVQQMVMLGRSHVKHGDLIERLERGETEVELDGYPVTGALFGDLSELDLRAALDDVEAGTGIVHFARPVRRAARVAEALRLRQGVVAVPPLWIRSDFLATPTTGSVLASQGVLPFLPFLERGS